MILFDEIQKPILADNSDPLSEIPSAYRETISAIAQAQEQRDFQKTLHLSQQLEKKGADISLWALPMSIALLELGKTSSAESTIRKLYRKEPDDIIVSLHMAVCLQVSKKYQQAEEVLQKAWPPEFYIPFYYSTYGDVLENQMKLEEAYSMYHTVAMEYENGHDPGTVLMDGIFQRLIELGMVIGQDTVSGDVDAYIHFLEKQENTDSLQERVSENLVLFAHYLENPAYRPPFQKLAGYLRDSGFITLPIYRTTLRTAFESLESYAMREDRKISSFLMDLVLCSMNIGTEEDREIDRQAGLTEEEEEAIQKEEIQLLLRKYFSVRRLPGLLRDFEYLKAHYPYAYQSVQAIECELKDDPRRMSEDSLKQLMEKDGGARSYYDHLYTELYESGTVVWDSDAGSLRHARKKVGRNDPCPCGSGKKYKHCCGWNR